MSPQRQTALVYVSCFYQYNQFYRNILILSYHKLVSSSLKTKEGKIYLLVEQIYKFQNIVNSREIDACENSLCLNLCKYISKSETVLKRHASRRHKTETLREIPAYEGESKNFPM